MYICILFERKRDRERMREFSVCVFRKNSVLLLFNPPPPPQKKKTPPPKKKERKDSTDTKNT